MGHKHDFWERLRTMFARPVGALVTGRRCSKQEDDQCVGYVEMGEERFEKRLHKMGFHRNPLSTWKYAVHGGESGTWRKTQDEWQLHVTFYSEDERTYVYAHWEYRWDRKPLAHLRSEGLNVSKGVNTMRRELTMADIDWHNESKYK